MEVNEVITKFQEFVERNCQTELFENIRHGKHVLIIDFQELCKFNLDVSEELLDKPEETLKAFELAIKNFDLGENANDIKQITVRVKNLPKEQYILIRIYCSFGRFFTLTVICFISFAFSPKSKFFIASSNAFSVSSGLSSSSSETSKLNLHNS